MAHRKFAPLLPHEERIDIHDSNGMRMWVKAFGISREKLEAAVLVAGTDALKVRLHLSRETDSQ